jgi:putative membrane protein
MDMAIKVLTGIIALLHFYFLYMEMFGWTTIAPKAFNQFPMQFFKDTKALAGNQGLYNGFLAAGLVWSLLISNAEWQHNVSLFFLVCVAIAGAYGATTVSKRIFFIQALPALVTIVLELLR